MCRILGYVGLPIALDRLLYAPPFSIEHQSHAPRHQVPGRINADGWGVAWYDPLVDGGRRPARYRTATPMWADRRFRDIADFIGSGHVVAAVRNASPGAPIEETGSSPFIAGRYAFTHNGFVTSFRTGLGEDMRRQVNERQARNILGSADSEVLFAMVLDRLDRGASMIDALGELLDDLDDDGVEGKFNFILSDGATMVATREGNSLFTLERAGSDTADASDASEFHRVVASEPYDDDPDWIEVPDHSFVTVNATALTVQPR
jgi:gamma-glutamyl hercynylcysteine S-oxide hydrolase